MNFTDKVRHYIQKWTMTDLQAMSELAFELTLKKQESYEKRNGTEYHQDIARVAIYTEYKNKTRQTDWKSFTDTQADKLAKKEAMETHNYIEHKNEYMLYKWLLDRLLERKIEVSVIHKNSEWIVNNSK